MGVVKIIVGIIHGVELGNLHLTERIHEATSINSEGVIYFSN